MEATAKAYLSFLGLLNQTSDMVPLGKLHLRPSGIISNASGECTKTPSLNATIQLDQMENTQNLSQECSLHLENPPSATILMDASQTRWGHMAK